jgi:hypothetical protein
LLVIVFYVLHALICYLDARRIRFLFWGWIIQEIFFFPILILLFDVSVAAFQARIEFAIFPFCNLCTYCSYSANAIIVSFKNEEFHLEVLLLRRQYEVPVCTRWQIASR